MNDTLHRAALAEHEAWMRDLEAERVTRSNESMSELLRRLERERPESPYQRGKQQERHARQGRKKVA